MQLRGSLLLVCLTLLIVSFLTPIITYNQAKQTTMQAHTDATASDFAAVDPNYIYDQLYTMVTRFQSREAGYDKSAANGHVGFADYWTQEMLHNLQGFGPQVRKDPFTVKGWSGRPAVSPAFNVEVSIPGATHPEQVVIIGCHYDGEAISTQSANDDGSGCAIELGVARALGGYWSQHHTYPSRTLRFVIFDAEEQGVLGSFHYVNNTVNGDLNNIVAMFNEEQNGIAYPLRYLGQLKNPQLPFNIDMSPLINIPQLYPNQDKLSQAQKEHIAHFRMLLQQALPLVFAKFQALDYRELTYHATSKQDVAQPIFTADQTKNVHLEDDTLGGSDQIPFTQAGIPCATFVGNSSYYDQNPPPWSYPFDQKQDTIQLMNTFADGSAQKSNALALALALPGMFTTWMLNQNKILGQTSSNQLQAGKPIAAISDIGITQPGQSLTLDAKAALAIDSRNASMTSTWNFGDGTQASGTTVHHTYNANGTYTLTMIASTTTGQQSVSKTIHVSAQPTHYANPYEQYIDEQTGIPPSNPQVVLPTPNDTQSDKIIGETGTTTSGKQSQQLSRNTEIPLAFIVAIGVALAVILIGLVVGIGLLVRGSQSKL